MQLNALICSTSQPLTLYYVKTTNIYSRTLSKRLPRLTLDNDVYGFIERIKLYQEALVLQLVDITKSQWSQTKLDELREQTVVQARELLEQQIDMAQTIAVALGQNTAKAESLLENLMEHAKRDK